MKINCKNCNTEVDLDKDECCPGCKEKGLVVLFSKEALEPAEKLILKNKL